VADARRPFLGCDRARDSRRCSRRSPPAWRWRRAAFDAAPQDMAGCRGPLLALIRG